MSTGTRYSSQPKVGASPTQTHPVDDDNVPIVKSSLKYAEAITAGWTSAATKRLPDALCFSGDTVAKVIMADGGTTEVDLPLAGKTMHAISIKKLVSVTNSVTVVAAWFVKP
jgi:hypothetical protein